MTLASLTTLLGVWIVALLSPGPDVVAVIRTALRSRRAGVACACGVMTGNAGWITASLAGVAALITAHPHLLAWAQVIGGAYLAWLGYRALRGGLAARGTEAVDLTGASPAAPSLAAAWRYGLSVNLANPKALVFFGAVFAQCVGPEMGWHWGLGVAVAMVAIGLAWFAGLALAAGAAAARIIRYWWLMDAIAGAIFLVLAVAMILGGLRVVVG